VGRWERNSRGRVVTLRHGRPGGNWFFVELDRVCGKCFVTCAKGRGDVCTLVRILGDTSMLTFLSLNAATLYSIRARLLHTIGCVTKI
jgi:hypothetical protein